MKREPKIKPRTMLGVLLHGVPQDVYLLNSFTALISGRLDYYSSAAGAKEGWSVQPVLVTAPPKRGKRRRSGAGEGVRKMLNIEHYRLAPGGEGDDILVGNWKDKPHRLVYDLCDEIALLRGSKAELVEAARYVIRSRLGPLPDAHGDLDGALDDLARAIANAET